MNKKNRKKVGYSLIEALVALGILLLGIVPIVTVGAKAILFHHRASESEEAARVSQTMIDYIKSRGYDNLGDFTTTTPYTLTSTGSAFTIDQFADDFGIPSELVILNSKGINLNQVSLYVDIKTIKGDLKDYNGNDDTYTEPITGSTTGDVYKEDIIYGKFIFGFGNTTTDVDKKTGRETELESTFIMTPIENWK